MDNLMLFEEFLGYHCTKYDLRGKDFHGELTGRYTHYFIDSILSIIQYSGLYSKMVAMLPEYELTLEDLDSMRSSRFEDVEAAADELSVLFHDLGVRILFTSQQKLVSHGDKCYQMSMKNKHYISADDPHDLNAAAHFYIEGKNQPVASLLESSARDADIQALVDIINTTTNSTKADKYKAMLLGKYGYKYEGPKDQARIDNPSLDYIVELPAFSSYAKYKEYARGVLKLRQRGLDYSKFHQYSPSSIGKDELSALLTSFGIKHEFSGTGHHSTVVGGSVRFSNSDVFDKFHVLHEVAHLFQDRAPLEITYALTEYGLESPLETFAENAALYAINRPYFNRLLPDVCDAFDRLLPDWYAKFARQLLAHT